METPVIKQVDEKKIEEKKPKILENEKEEKTMKTVVCVDYDSDASVEDYYDMSDNNSNTISIDEMLDEISDKLWNI